MKSIAELEEALTNPSERLIEDLRNNSGDILVLGISGKMGPSLAVLAKRALRDAGINKRIIGVASFSDPSKKLALETAGVETIRGDLLDPSFLASLPSVENVIFMAGHKFGTSGKEDLTWAVNTYLPGQVAERFKTSRIVAFSTGNVYPFVDVSGDGATENTPPSPVGEYAQSCLGRERIFQYFSKKHAIPTLLFRLNYALDLRYGVLNDIARKVLREEPIDLSMGYVNVIWQGDANEYALRSLLHCQSPSAILNITGPEKLELEMLADNFAERLGKTPNFTGKPMATALLSDARKAHDLFGPPSVNAEQMIDWTVQWIKNEGTELNKPTHFQTRDGQF